MIFTKKRQRPNDVHSTSKWIRWYRTTDACMARESGGAKYAAMGLTNKHSHDDSSFHAYSISKECDLIKIS
jgi:hypothetical protein